MSPTPLSNPGERRRGVHDRFLAEGPVLFPPLFRLAESAATHKAGIDYFARVLTRRRSWGAE